MENQNATINKNRLSPTEVITGALGKIKTDYSGVSVYDLGLGTVLSEITDSNGKSTERIDYMRYDSLVKVVLEDRLWILAVGKKCGGNRLEERYASDLIALQIDNRLSLTAMKVEFRMRVEHENNFKNSFVIGLTSGYLVTPKSSLFDTNVINELKKFLTSVAHQDPRFGTIGGNPIYTELATYSPGAVDCLAEAMIKALKARN